MQSPKSIVTAMLAIVIAISTSAGLMAAYRRFHVEAANRRVEIALEWQEIALLAQAAGRPIQDVLAVMKRQNVSTIVLVEDTVTTLEQSGAIHPSRAHFFDRELRDEPFTLARLDTRADFDRIAAALKLRDVWTTTATNEHPDSIRTVFEWADTSASPASLSHSGQPDRVQIAAAADYANLRTMGVGLPPDALSVVAAAGMRIAGRIANFPGVNEGSARAALQGLVGQGASTVIFNGEEVLGYRDPALETSIADQLRASDENGRSGGSGEPFNAAPVYGAVEFGKQRGDEKLAVQLHGDFVRVHSIQSAEMGQMEEDEAVDRFVRAAKERNIRFCYVRLPTFAGQDPLAANVLFLSKIARGMANGTVATGGGLAFGAARRYAETGVTGALFGIIALGAAAGIVWMLHVIAPLPQGRAVALLLVLGLACAALSVLLGEPGRKLVAFVAGVVFPTVACLVTYPGRKLSVGDQRGLPAGECLGHQSALACLGAALRGICVASIITALGIVQVVGLLATRPFMLRANQFLGIKAQHAIPLLFVALIATAGGVCAGDSWARFRVRAIGCVRQAMDQPARFGLLILGVLALVGLVLVVARTGNDAGVGVSGPELKMRTILDRILPVRPRTKEFLVGHPAYLLALAWWWRGRRRLAIPAFVVGSLGQVSLLNTFCHIHTPLIVSLWRDGLGLVIGVLIGAAIFLCGEAAAGIRSRSPSRSPAGLAGVAAPSVTDQ